MVFFCKLQQHDAGPEGASFYKLNNFLKNDLREWGGSRYGMSLTAALFKKYFVRIRTYKVYKGKKYYSAWSKYKKVKTKK